MAAIHIFFNCSRTSIKMRPSMFLPLPSPAVAPIAVVGGVLDELRIARGKEELGQFVVLRELRQHRLAHDVDLHRFPIAPQLLLAAAAEPRGDHRRAGLANFRAIRLVLEFLRLKVVLGSRPGFAVQLDREPGEIGELAEVVGDAVEVDGVHGGCLSGNDFAHLRARVE
jgi:hypothetical protein